MYFIDGGKTVWKCLPLVPLRASYIRGDSYSLVLRNMDLRNTTSVSEENGSKVDYLFVIKMYGEVQISVLMNTEVTHNICVHTQCTHR